MSMQNQKHHNIWTKHNNNYCTALYQNLLRRYRRCTWTWTEPLTPPAMLCGALSRCVQVRKVSLTIDSCQRASNSTTDECQDGQENTTNTSTMPRSTFGLLDSFVSCCSIIQIGFTFLDESSFCIFYLTCWLGITKSIRPVKSEKRCCCGQVCVPFNGLFFKTQTWPQQHLFSLFTGRMLYVMPNQHVRLKMQKELSSRKVKPSWILLKQEIKESNKPNVLRGMAKNQQRSS